MKFKSCIEDTSDSKVFSKMAYEETEEEQTEQNDECTKEPEQTLEEVLMTTPLEPERVTTKTDGSEEATNETASNQRNGGPEQDCAEIVNTNTTKNVEQDEIKLPTIALYGPIDLLVELYDGKPKKDDRVVRKKENEDKDRAMHCSHEILTTHFVTGGSSRETDSSGNLNRKEYEETQPEQDGNEEIAAPNEKQNDKIEQSCAKINKETEEEGHSRETKIFTPNKPSSEFNKNVIEMLKQGNNFGNNPFLALLEVDWISEEQKSLREEEEANSSLVQRQLQELQQFRKEEQKQKSSREEEEAKNSLVQRQFQELEQFRKEPRRNYTSGSSETFKQIKKA